MSEMKDAEAVIFKKGTVRITNMRAIIGNKTYVMSNVTSVSVAKQKPNYALLIIIVPLLVGGLFATFGGLSQQDLNVGLAGIAALALGIWMLRSARTKYIVKIGSASGESNALRSQDEGYIREIVKAMNEAIVRRG